MPINDNDDRCSANRREHLLTLLGSGVTLAVLLAADYFAPDLLALAAR